MMTPRRLAEIKNTALLSSHILGPMALDLITEIERLQAELRQAQAELDELRRGLDALGKVRLSGLSEGDTDYGVRLAGEIDEGQ